jgi:hypothetical protein
MPFVSVAVEGGLLPSDLLERIATGEGAGQRPDDFGLPAGRRLTDETQAAFSDVCAFWDTFQRRLAHSRESATTLTREAWVLPLLERLDFALVYQRSRTLPDGESYAVSHRAGEDEDAPPVDVVAIGQPLDRRSNGARRSPHALVQEYLNRTDALWGLVTNGERLRLLRDSSLVSHPTYVELDLRAMVEGNLYSDFSLLYRLLHRSRFPQGGADAHECRLERYFQEGVDAGGRVREHLRVGVEAALQELGTAFLVHPENERLRTALREGTLSPAGYYRQLLRLVYRFLFLFVAEERRLVFPEQTAEAPGAAADEEQDAPVLKEGGLGVRPDAYQDVYARYYSMSALRERCERYFADDRHSDLWKGRVYTFRLFSDPEVASLLRLTALGGELFTLSDLERAALENARLLLAVYHLSTFADVGVRRRVNYAGLDVEELGSVYESLLDYRPHVEQGAAPRFTLVTGSERRQTGSYYTPPEMVRELIDHALVPVMEERLAGAKTAGDKEHALLGLRVCDPAAGSGHFLLAAARRIGRELARVRTGEAEPTPEAYRVAVRDAIRHCVYAVDKNPLAVDLCKVSLWIEGHNAGLPLSFLNHHVKCGDSLVGVADLKVLEEGIPDEAYKRSDKEQAKAGRAYRDRNRKERETGAHQLSFSADGIDERLLDLGVVLEDLERIPDDSARRVAEKSARYEAARGTGSGWWVNTTACHLWTAPFFLDFQPNDPSIPTTGSLRAFRADHKTVDGRLAGAARGAATDSTHPFFHWPLEFPDVILSGGFDVILGNPPFAGGLKLSTTFGEPYRNYLAAMYPPAGGTMDLSAYFLRRAFELTRPGAHVGLVATNSIGQGDTREGGLAVVIATGGTITFARRFIKWPGTANVEVNLVAARNGTWHAERILDGQPLSFISSRLDGDPEQEPLGLAQNGGQALIGSFVLGLGFLLDQAEARALLNQSPTNDECLFPYLNGEDLNARPDQTPRRWAINFRNWPLERAEEYPSLLTIVRERAKPERDRLASGDATARDRARRWWQFARPTLAVYDAISNFRRVLVRSRVSELHAPCFVPTGWVYDIQVVVFAFDDDFHFALLQSNIHEAWVRRNASTMRTDIRYTPTDCFDTFPFPQDRAERDEEWAGRIGAEYHEHRRQTMLSHKLGLTKTYNLFNSPECRDKDIERLRTLHKEMDRAVLACYGWQDLSPGHGFHKNDRGQTRYTVSPEARREINRRLLELNLRVAREEEAQGS